MNLQEYLTNDPFWAKAKELMNQDYDSDDLYDMWSPEYKEVKEKYDYTDWDLEQISNHMDYLEDEPWMNENRNQSTCSSYGDAENWEVAMCLILSGTSLTNWRAIKEECDEHQSEPSWFPLDVLDEMISIKEKRDPAKTDEEIENITADLMSCGWNYEDLEEAGHRDHTYSFADEYGENWSRILKAAKQMEQEEE